MDSDCKLTQFKIYLLELVDHKEQLCKYARVAWLKSEINHEVYIMKELLNVVDVILRE